ncbi:hypothetical protein I7Z51_002526 [Vibrio parahaemolyticus]|uniref:hypothetical protein n=1 Tax=Vibrio TaxID=662 RepID=UPI001A8FDAEE|nr:MULTISPECIES: hypothetical protein [Vibrio]EGQ7973602.1 hypothetical protein [Vibrio parahaemolyticus]MBO0209809.1 hypothetical protein [Vibrio sp. Vb0877]MCR9811872.1 hypothetical protein [Vibrio parahaemolyticus]MDW2320268.1 hypothetical protein [Vibrio sp. 1159]
MEFNNVLLGITIASITAFGITLGRHILFKRELYLLKQDMKQHTIEHGIDDALWQMFVLRTRKMLRFWR